MIRKLLFTLFPKTIKEIQQDAIELHELLIQDEIDEYESEQIFFGEVTDVVIEFKDNQNVLTEKMLFAITEHLGVDFFNLLKDKYNIDLGIKVRNELLARESK